jgi:mRNA interferase RelE/StbE
MFKVIIEKRILTDLDKLHIKTAAKILGIVESLSFAPRPRGSKKLEGRESLYRVKRGDYRIIYEINYNDKEVKIVMVKHRKEAYRRI